MIFCKKGRYFPLFTITEEIYTTELSNYKEQDENGFPKLKFPLSRRQLYFSN